MTVIPPALTYIEASAPGTLMLFGEHAVLRHGHALCTAIDQRLKVILIPRDDFKIKVHSQLGVFTCPCDQIPPPHPPFSYVLGVLHEYAFCKTQGFEIHIQSEFSSTIGFGSSSALITALTAALELFKLGHLNLRRIFYTARKVLHKIQGAGSGTDLATAIYGGIVFYRPYPLIIEKLTQSFALTAIYSGQKTPTPIVIQKINQQAAHHPEQYEQYFKTIEQLTLQAEKAIRAQDWRKLGALMNAQQMIMESMKLSTPAIHEVLQSLQTFNLLGAKISGSGLGDCVITLGALPPDTFPQNPSQKALGIQQIPIQISSQGVTAEKFTSPQP